MDSFEVRLKDLLSEVVKDLMNNIISLISNHLYIISIKKGYYVISSNTQNKNGSTVLPGEIIDESIMRMAITEVIESFESTKKLCNLMTESGRWYNNAAIGSTRENFDIINSFPAAFITRMFVLGDHEINNNLSNFETAFSELLGFLKKDTVDSMLYIHLAGLYGTIENLTIGGFASIKQMGAMIAKEFTLKFGSSHFTNNYQVKADDYALVVHIQYPKTEFGDFNHYTAATNVFYNEYINKLRLILYLSIGGYFSIGEFRTYTTDWPIIPTIGSYPPFEPSRKELSKYNNLNNIRDRLINTYKKVESISLKKISPLIDTSFNRLMKSKHSRNISDRIIELAIAFETMIATSKSEVVGLQLKIKLINLIYEQNDSDIPFKILTDFYNLRSDIVHGNSLVLENEKNIGIIDEAERLIQAGLLKLIILLQDYSEKKIKNALHKSLYSKYPLSKILLE